MSQSAKISKFPRSVGRHEPPADVSDVAVKGPGDPDPTREIRSLIESLQIAAREAQVRQEMAEEERDELQARLDAMQVDLAAAEALEQKILSLEHERDALAEKQKSFGDVTAELRTKINVAERQRKDALKQRDEAARLFKESQSTIDEVNRGRDDVLKQRDAAIRQRDFANKERAEFADKLKDLSGLLADAQRALVDAKKGAGSAQKADAAIQQQILSLRQARDNAASQAAEMKDRIAGMEDEVAVLDYDRESALKAAAKATADLDALKKKVEADSGVRDAESGKISDLLAEVESVRAQHAALCKERDAAAKTVSELSGTVLDLQKRNAALKKRNGVLSVDAREAASRIKELRVEVEKRAAEAGGLRAEYREMSAAIDAARQRDREREAELEELRASLLKDDRQGGGSEALIAEHTGEIAKLTSELAAARETIREGAARAKDFERMRLQMIEVTAELETARHQIRELGASLAEARLMSRQQRPSPPARTKADPVASATDGNAAMIAVDAMRQCFRRLERSPDDAGAILELHSHVHCFCEGAAVAGQRTVHRVSGAFGFMLRAFTDDPAAVGSGTVEAIGRTIELLAALGGEPNADKRASLDRLRAYVVDDERESCEFVARAMKTAGIWARTTINPGEAIAELAASRYDVVLLDVFLPEINGFEICSHIKNLPLHAQTPVVFISGDVSAENALEASQRGASDIIAKPVKAEELGLRALAAIVRAQLGIE